LIDPAAPAKKSVQIMRGTRPLASPPWPKDHFSHLGFNDQFDSLD